VRAVRRHGAALVALRDARVTASMRWRPVASPWPLAGRPAPGAEALAGSRTARAKPVRGCRRASDWMAETRCCFSALDSAVAPLASDLPPCQAPNDDPRRARSSSAPLTGPRLLPVSRPQIDWERDLLTPCTPRSARAIVRCSCIPRSRVGTRPAAGSNGPVFSPWHAEPPWLAGWSECIEGRHGRGERAVVQCGESGYKMSMPCWQ
jgi:hypothetical protein